jgi:nitrate/TMAO reductase-like tetraheme cytochrome c subunit
MRNNVVWGKIFGTILTRETFGGRRVELALHEWSHMKANDLLDG